MNPTTIRQYTEIDPTLSFQFIGIDDSGPESGASCPCCGAEGRYIYKWAEYGKVFGAMAGCFEVAMKMRKLSELEKIKIGISKKLSRGKALNGWERTIQRMEDFKSAGKFSKEWCDSKITEALSQRQAYLSKR